MSLREIYNNVVDGVAYIPRLAVKFGAAVAGNVTYYGSRLMGADTETAQARYDKVKEVGETINGAIDTGAEFAKHPVQGLKGAFNENSDLNPMNWLRRTLERVTDFLLDKAQAATIRIVGEGKISNWLGEMRDKNLFVRSEEHGAGSVETAAAEVEEAAATATAPEEMPAAREIQTAPEEQPQAYVPQAPLPGMSVMTPGF